MELLCARRAFRCLPATSLALTLGLVTSATAQWQDVDSQLVGSSAGSTFALGTPPGYRIQGLEVAVDSAGEIRNLGRTHASYLGTGRATAYANDYPGLALPLDLPDGDPLVAITVDDVAPFSYLRLESLGGVSRSIGNVPNGESTVRLEMVDHEIAVLSGFRRGRGASATIEGLQVTFRPLHETSRGPLPVSASPGTLQPLLVSEGVRFGTVIVRLAADGSILGLRARVLNSDGTNRGTTVWKGASSGGTTEEVSFVAGDFLDSLEAWHSPSDPAVFHALRFHSDRGQTTTIGTPQADAVRIRYLDKPGAEIVGLLGEWQAQGLTGFGVVYRAATGRSYALGDACTGGGTIALDPGSLPQIGGSLELQITSPSGTPFLMFSNEAATTPLGGCDLHVASWAVPGAFPVAAPTTSIPLPNDLNLYMLPLHFQGFDPVAGGPVFGVVAMTNGIAVQVGALR